MRKNAIQRLKIDSNLKQDQVKKRKIKKENGKIPLHSFDLNFERLCCLIFIDLLIEFCVIKLN